MKRRSGIITVGFYIMLALAANLFAAGEVTVTGTLYAVAWDEDDNVIEAVISGEGGEYIIVNNSVGQKLCKMAGAYVEVTGVIGKDVEGNRTITVVDYQATTEQE